MKLTRLLLAAGLLFSLSLNAAPADGSVPPAATKSFRHYFLPTSLRAELTREAWGAIRVLPRDVPNGIEAKIAIHAAVRRNQTMIGRSSQMP